MKNRRKMHQEPAQQVYQVLLDAYGPQRWWPADGPWEVMVGAVLVQGTAWANVEKAVERLKAADALRLDSLRRLSRDRLEALIRPAGFYRVKAERLRNLVDLVGGDYSGRIEQMAGVGTAELRASLLSVRGIGPETADSILCYAFDRPVMVADEYARRVFVRHGWLDARAGYAEVQRAMGKGMPDETAVCNEMHALLVRVGHLHCSKTPQCAGCPLECLLPTTGPAAD